MKADEFTFESVARLHMTAEPERQQAGLRAWAAALAGNTPDQTDSGRLLTISEVAKRTGVSRPLVYRVIARGLLTVIHPYPGSSPRVAEGDVLNWIRSRRGQT